MEHLTLQAAADQLEMTKKRLWRAVKAGKLEAIKVEVGGSWEYQVSINALELYRDTIPVSRDSGTPCPATTEVSRDASRDMSRDSVPVSRDGGTASPPVELYLEMLDRLQRAERRAVELEIALQQSQRLLTENAESIVESATLLKEAEAKIAKSTQKTPGWFSWLSRRRVSTSPKEESLGA